MNTNNFDFLRFLFAFCIALGHLIILTPEKTWESLLPYIKSPYFIHGFYAISGFLITKSYYRSNSLKSYFLKRIKRIFPAYYFNIIFFSLILVFVSTYIYNDYYSNPDFYRYLFFNLIFQNYLQPTLPGVFTDNPIMAVNGALWTIKIEEAFYLCVPIILVIFKKLKNNYYWLLILYIGSIVFFNYFNNASSHTLAKQLPGVLCYFLGGMFLYLKFEWMVRNKYILLVLSLVIIFLERWLSPITILFPFFYSMFIILIAYIYPFAKNFGKYGDFTYGIYIFHFPMIQLAITLGFYDVPNPQPQYIITLLAIILSGIFSWYGIERKFVRRSYLQNSKS